MLCASKTGTSVLAASILPAPGVLGVEQSHILQVSFYLARQEKWLRTSHLHSAACTCYTLSCDPGPEHWAQGQKTFAWCRVWFHALRSIWQAHCVSDNWFHILCSWSGIRFKVQFLEVFGMTNTMKLFYPLIFKELRVPKITLERLWSMNSFYNDEGWS